MELRYVGVNNTYRRRSQLEWQSTLHYPDIQLLLY